MAMTEPEKRFGGFVKVGVPVLSPMLSPVVSSILSSEQKVLLNRKANEMFNNGLVEDAKRVYLATGYSDGLTRVADTYMAKGREMDALKLYLQAHNQRNSAPLTEKLAKIISKIMSS
jgi:hypothetical protein